MTKHKSGYDIQINMFKIQKQKKVFEHLYCIKIQKKINKQLRSLQKNMEAH